MDIIKTGLGLTKTLRNVTRLREVATIFARHGFSEFISGPLRMYIPNIVLPASNKNIKKELEDSNETNWSGVIGHRLRLVFEELGPGAIKLGQLLASREDIFDEPFIRQMKILQDKVKPVPFDEVKEVLVKSLGVPIEEVFEHIDKEPIGTASIGVVYQAKLKTGEDVVVKVKRPNIDKVIETDFSILLFIIKQVEKVSEEIRYLGLSRAIEDFASSLQSELNFNIETLNCQRFAKNLEGHDKEGVFQIPKVYNKFCHHDVIVMEKLKGIPFTHSGIADVDRAELEEKLETGVVVFLKTMLQDGFFHADLHGGNFFYLDNGKIGLIDFGLMGSLSRKSRKSFVAIIYSLLSFNYENLVYEFLDVAEYDKTPDLDALISDVRTSLSPFVGLTVQQTDLTLIFKHVIGALRKHQIYLPKDWYIVFRALMTLDGVGKSLDIDFDIYGMMEEDIQELVKDVFSKDELLEEGIWTAKDLLASMRMIPRHLRWFTKKWAKDDYTFQLNVSGHEKELKNLSFSLNFLGFALLASVFTLSGVLTLGEGGITDPSQVPVLSWVFWSLGFVSFVRGWKSL